MNSGRTARVAALAVILLGLALHLILAWQLHDFVDPDEAVVGLMARHIVAGTSRPVFYYGQPYLGALEAYGAAAVLALAGDGVEPLRYYAVGLWLLLALAVWWLAEEVGGPWSAPPALALLAIAPPSRALWDLKLRGGFTLGAALLAATLAAGLAARRRPGSGRDLCLGVLAGLTLWTQQLAAAALLVILVARWRQGPRPWWLVPGLLCGAAPLLVYNAAHGLETVRYLAPRYVADTTTTGHNLRVLAATTMPDLLGGADLVRRGLVASAWPMTGFVAGLILALAWVRRRELAAAVVGRGGPVEVVLLALLVSVPVRRNYQLNQLLHWVPMIAVLLAIVPMVLHGRWLHGRWLRGRWLHMAWLVPVVVSAIELNAWLPHHRRDATPVRELLTVLRARGVRAVHAEHRPAYLIAYHSKESIAAVPDLSYGYFVDRIPALSARALADPEAAHVFEAGSANEAAFRATGPTALPIAVAGYSVYLASTGSPVGPSQADP